MRPVKGRDSRVSTISNDPASMTEMVSSCRFATQISLPSADTSSPFGARSGPDHHRGAFLPKKNDRQRSGPTAAGHVGSGAVRAQTHHVSLPSARGVGPDHGAGLQVHQGQLVRVLHGSHRVPSVREEQRGVGTGIGAEIDACYGAGAGHVDQNDVAPGTAVGSVLRGQSHPSVGRDRHLVRNDRPHRDSRDLYPRGEVDEGDAAAGTVGHQQGALQRLGPRQPETTTEQPSRPQQERTS